MNSKSNQYCIGIGYDFKYVYCHSQGLGKHTSIKRTIETFSNHIEQRSNLIHDQEYSHRALVDLLDLNSYAYSSKECKLLKESDNPLKPINDQCALIKQFLNSHRGFSRDYLQDYLNLYAFIINPPYERLEKIEYLIIRGLSDLKTVKYRTVMSKKHSK